MMNRKWLSSILVAIFSIAALVFIIIGKFNFAVLAMTIMFAMSNGFRAKSFEEQGYGKEAIRLLLEYYFLYGDIFCVSFNHRIHHYSYRLIFTK